MHEQVQSGNFTFTRTPIQGVVVVDARRFPDNRGFFMEAYKRCDFEAGGIADDFVQENQSRSVRGVLRGLHFQREHPQSKLVRVLAGEAFDVAVDLRPESPTFGRWHGEVLSADNGRQLYIPHGCAHGILILSEEAVFAYKADDVYHPGDEGAIAWDDPVVAVEWPLPAEQVVLSEKDARQPSFESQFAARGAAAL